MKKAVRKSPETRKTKSYRQPQKVKAGQGEDTLSAILAQQREILEQLGLCTQLLGELPDFKILDETKRSDAQSAILMWHETLVLAARRNTSFVQSALADIPDEPDPTKRALALWPIIGTCVDALDASPSENTKRFLLHVAWHEGDKLRTREQYGNGPARSFYQFEAYRAKEALQYARQAGYIDKLVATSGYSKKELKAAEDALPNYDPKDSACSYFPSDNLIRTLLEENDQFGTYLVRVAFRKVAASIGVSNAEHADYWYKYWKVSGGNPDQLKKTFTKEADEVDALLAKMFSSEIS
ncbi:hypothetical protein G6M78_20670 [Agrobacterium tumefaciens]|uniref:hypothetical protein n=1 Tax=Agrobacterium tumefaciens TaxID=358 RepID=UPI001573C421|nr:hypothetical protein [Agrobacterium tumefaciens]NTE57479.1 hypothetical protein [Agrobacterium tumefaciens]NTE69973.1 hypothetical protein [Agrobacterium tumefaciens]